jgi:hypothetical protein
LEEAKKRSDDLVESLQKQLKLREKTEPLFPNYPSSTKSKMLDLNENIDSNSRCNSPFMNDL